MAPADTAQLREPAADAPDRALSDLLGVPVVLKSPCMAETFQLARRAAQTNATVLITGETGAGKDIVARAIHHYSLRCSRALVEVNCGALPEQLAESELFGYEKGAFSGADSVKPGMFELAHRGTLFLDEVGELDARLQVKLLRVLDSGSYYRLGGVRRTSVDVRVVAATNAELEQSMRAGGFRRDLFHRLSQVRITVPPLRERREEIRPLAEHFLREVAPHLRLSPEAVEALESYPWPGNIRELRNAVTSAAVLGKTEVIGAGELPEAIGGSNSAGPAPAAADSSLAGLERTAVLRALAETGGHQERAAQLLGISRRTLIRRLKIYKHHARTEAGCQFVC
jgi:transcriptional regulator with PAS, ATPase and Fis domain